MGESEVCKPIRAFHPLHAINLIEAWQSRHMRHALRSGHAPSPVHSMCREALVECRACRFEILSRATLPGDAGMRTVHVP